MKERQLLKQKKITVIPGLRAAQNPDCEGRMPKRTFAQRMARRASRGCGE
jgi:hypothetical protein